MNFAAFDGFLLRLAEALGTDGFVLNPLIAVVLLGVTCGCIGSTVVGNRMAFFSDAMAHTAFAGVALAVLCVIVLFGVRTTLEAGPYLWVVLPVMIATGVVGAVLMTAARERTGLTNDTVIGVFFAASVGLAATIVPKVREYVNIDPEQFLYGSILLTGGEDIAYLFALCVLTVASVCWRYNAWAVAAINPSLAKSRGVAVRLDTYYFAVLLALVVNVSLQSVGVLLINALLVVPAAAAANVARNLRQVFAFTLFGTVGAGVVGLLISQNVTVPVGRGRGFEPGPSGTIVVVCVLGFFATMAVGSLRARRPANTLAPRGVS